MKQTWVRIIEMQLHRIQVLLFGQYSTGSKYLQTDIRKICSKNMFEYVDKRAFG